MLNRHVAFYLFNLDEYDYLLNEQELFSTKEERVKSELYISPKSKHKLISYMIRRIVLAKALECDPLAIKYIYNEFGKPYIDDNKIYFNVSHTQNWFVIGLSLFKELGIDIEVVKYILKMNSFINSFCTKSEKSHILSQIGMDKELFIHLNWCLKESFIKAQGKGLDEDFKKLSFKEIFDENGNKDEYAMETMIWKKNNQTVERIFSSYVIYEGEVTIPIAISVRITEQCPNEDIDNEFCYRVNPDLNDAKFLPTDYDD